jgi:EAL domain-containing protein (putative c-di-GMP-specific phosphodiesterase class I)
MCSKTRRTERAIREDRQVVRTGKSVGLNVIAEGVETRERFMRLQAQQCAEGQRDYFSAPLAADVFDALLGSDLSVTVLP